MGVVIRPAIFAREIASSGLNPIQKPIRAWRARYFDLRFAALILAIMALAWILALAGAAFAVRAVLVLCFAHLAGRTRRVGVPAEIVRRRVR
jgi:hypothetical protein